MAVVATNIMGGRGVFVNENFYVLDKKNQFLTLSWAEDDEETICFLEEANRIYQEWLASQRSETVVVEEELPANAGAGAPMDEETTSISSGSSGNTEETEYGNEEGFCSYLQQTLLSLFFKTEEPNEEVVVEEELPSRLVKKMEEIAQSLHDKYRKIVEQPLQDQDKRQLKEAEFAIQIFVLLCVALTISEDPTVFINVLSFFQETLRHKQQMRRPVFFTKGKLSSNVLKFVRDILEKVSSVFDNSKTGAVIGASMAGCDAIKNGRLDIHSRETIRHMLHATDGNEELVDGALTFLSSIQVHELPENVKRYGYRKKQVAGKRYGYRKKQIAGKRYGYRKKQAAGKKRGYRKKQAAGKKN